LDKPVLLLFASDDEMNKWQTAADVQFWTSDRTSFPKIVIQSWKAAA
jgi:hypothetical protein